MKKRGKEQQDQEAPMTLEYFDYVIPEMLSAEYLLKDIIKTLKRTNEKTIFLDFNFSRELRHLPPKMLVNDDEAWENSPTCLLAYK